MTKIVAPLAAVAAVAVAAAVADVIASAKPPVWRSSSLRMKPRQSPPRMMAGVMMDADAAAAAGVVADVIATVIGIVASAIVRRILRLTAAKCWTPSHRRRSSL